MSCGENSSDSLDNGSYDPHKLHNMIGPLSSIGGLCCDLHYMNEQMSVSTSPASRRAIASRRRWPVNLGLRPRITPLAFACSRPGVTDCAPLSKQTGRQFLGLPGAQKLLLLAEPSHRCRPPFRHPYGKTVIESALEQDAFQRRRQIVIGSNKRRDRIGGRRGVHRREQFALRCNHLNTLSQRKNAGGMP